jgi:uncharacterized membrane protein YvbJ
MKTITIRFTAIAVLLFASSFSYASSVEKETNEVAITPVENLHLGKSVEKVWTISYSGQEKPVTIALRSVANGKEYVVRSEFFEVIYASDKNGFGVKKIHTSLKEVPGKINASVLNKQQMQNQKILTPNSVSDDYALGLIASYLPDLLNEGYKHLIY